MMILPLIILSIIQGITEFLPISSSGHLVLVHEFMNDDLNDLDEKRLDIAVHVGTLLAVILYFRTDFIEMVYGVFDIIRGRIQTTNAQQTWVIAVASIPVIIAGFTLYCLDMTMFDSLHVIGWTTLIFGILLYIADKRPESKIVFEDFTTKTAVIYGLFQVFALIPGVSRSGVTMTAGRFLGHSRSEAARMSLLMGMVTISAAGLLTGLDVFQDSSISNDFMMMMGIGIVLSFAAAYAAIWVMMKWFAGKGTMTPFVIYRVILGVTLLALLYSGVIAEDMQL
jgi:undecaprenyl-diphosphatase